MAADLCSVISDRLLEAKKDSLSDLIEFIRKYSEMPPIIHTDEEKELVAALEHVKKVRRIGSGGRLVALLNIQIRASYKLLPRTIKVPKEKTLFGARTSYSNNFGKYFPSRPWTMHLYPTGKSIYNLLIDPENNIVTTLQLRYINPNGTQTSFIEDVVRYIRRLSDEHKIYILRTKQNLCIKSPRNTYIIKLRVYHHIDNAIYEEKYGENTFIYDGSQVWTNPLGMMLIKYSTNIFDLDTSESFDIRSPYAIYLPNLNICQALADLKPLSTFDMSTSDTFVLHMPKIKLRYFRFVNSITMLSTAFHITSYKDPLYLRTYGMLKSYMTNYQINNAAVYNLHSLVYSTDDLCGECEWYEGLSLDDIQPTLPDKKQMISLLSSYLNDFQSREGIVCRLLSPPSIELVEQIMREQIILENMNDVVDRLLDDCMVFIEPLRELCYFPFEVSIAQVDYPMENAISPEEDDKLTREWYGKYYQEIV